MTTDTLDRLIHIRAELIAAERQSIDSDDQIIIDHIRSAIAQLGDVIYGDLAKGASK